MLCEVVAIACLIVGVVYSVAQLLPDAERDGRLLSHSPVLAVGQRRPRAPAPDSPERERVRRPRPGNRNGTRARAFCITYFGDGPSDGSGEEEEAAEEEGSACQEGAPVVSRSRPSRLTSPVRVSPAVRRSRLSGDPSGEADASDEERAVEAPGGSGAVAGSQRGDVVGLGPNGAAAQLLSDKFRSLVEADSKVGTLVMSRPLLSDFSQFIVGDSHDCFH